jgi:hypothetical protein
MASSGKRKTTMAKLTRESRLRERRLEKQARKNARKQAAADPPSEAGYAPAADVDEVAPDVDAGHPAPEPVGPTPPTERDLPIRSATN